MGCTEPAAISLACSYAFNVLKEKTGISPAAVKKIAVTVSGNIYKNAFAVGLPKTNGGTGIEFAASMGLFCNPDLRLKLFSSFGIKKLKSVKKIIKKTAVKIRREKGFYIKAGIFSKTDSASAVIEGHHTGLSSLKFNGKKIFRTEVKNKQDFGPSTTKLAKMDLKEILAVVKKLKSEDKEIIRRMIGVNWRASGYGLKKKCGLNVGRTLSKITKRKNLTDYVQIRTAAACDMRMSGENIEVMSVCGSGNQGIMCSVPIIAVAEKLKIPKEKLLEAVALAVLIESYFTYYEGYLTVLCGAVAKAGFGAAAGITYLMGGGVKKIERALKNYAGDLTGVLCDGAKPGCALKLASSSCSAVKNAVFSMENVAISDNQGIVGRDFKELAKNVSEISNGASKLDEKIIDIINKI